MRDRAAGVQGRGPPGGLEGESPGPLPWQRWLAVRPLPAEAVAPVLRTPSPFCRGRLGPAACLPGGPSPVTPPPPAPAALAPAGCGCVLETWTLAFSSSAPSPRISPLPWEPPPQPAPALCSSSGLWARVLHIPRAPCLARASPPHPLSLAQPVPSA